MTMVLPSPYDVVDTHHLLCLQQNHIDHHCTNAVVYGGEIDSIRRRSTSPAASIPTHCSSSSDRVVITDQMPDDYDPNQLSSSSFDPTADENWLNLRLGSDDRPTSSSSTRGGGGGVVELDLLLARANTSHQLQQHQLRQQIIRTNNKKAPPRSVPEINKAMMRPSNFIGGNYYMANPAAAAAASTSLMPMCPNFFARPNVGGGGEGMSSCSGIQIIRPPRRHQVGVWFMLQASRNQVRQPFLPQIPKSYLRIKNGQMTIRLLIKYLVQKLALESESEVEIRCRGQELEPIVTLQHVRDSMWCPRRDFSLNLHMDSPSSSSSASAAAVDSHIMILHYSRPILSAAAATTGTASSASVF